MIRRLLLLALLLAPGARAAIALDATACPTAATCPHNTVIGGTSPLTTGTFSTAAATTFLVAILGNANTNGVGTVTIAWNGGTPSGATAFVQQTQRQITASGVVGWVSSNIWTATATNTLSGVSVTSTITNASSSYSGSLLVYVVTCTNTCAVGTVSAGAEASTAATLSYNVTAAATSSWIFVSWEQYTDSTGITASGWSIDVSTADATDGNTYIAGRQTSPVAGTNAIASTVSKQQISVAIEVKDSAGGGASSARTPSRALTGVGK